MSITDILQKKTNLTYEEAWTAMTFGHKVQLSDWMGYWFMESIPAMETFTGSNAKTVLVFTRDGDILDTPFVERYKDRTDWQITDGKMGYDFAIRALKAGRYVAVDIWKNAWVELVPGKGWPMRSYDYDKLEEIAASLSERGATATVEEALRKFRSHENEIYMVPAEEYIMSTPFGYLAKFKKVEDGFHHEPYTPNHWEQLCATWIVV